MSKTLSGNKDVDLLTLGKLNDKDLLNVCLIKNKYIQSLCSNESFWRNRYAAKYGQDKLDLKPKNRSWRDQYMKVIIDLVKYSGDPWAFLKTISWDVSEGIGGVKAFQETDTFPFRVIKNLEDTNDEWKNNYNLLSLTRPTTKVLQIKFPDGKFKQIPIASGSYISPRDIINTVAMYYKDKVFLNAYRIFSGYWMGSMGDAEFFQVILSN